MSLVVSLRPIALHPIAIRFVIVVCALLLATAASAYTLHEGVDIGRGLKVDIHAPAEANKRRFLMRKRVPVIVYVHGGGWIKGSRDKVYSMPRFATSRGWMLVSVDYRPWPGANIDAQVGDVTRGIRWVQRNIRRYGGDRRRIVIMGHSAGSHLVAMVAARGTVKGLRGVIANDVQAYDMSHYARLRGNGLPHMYAKAFGTDGSNWDRWSPITHVKARRARELPPHLIMHSGGDIWKRRETLSRSYGEALRRRGAKVSYFGSRFLGHGAIMARIGRGDGPNVTAAVEAFLRRAFR